MKKALKIAGIILAVIILLMIAIPFLFKGKIKDAVLKVANEQLNATVTIEDFGLNLFSNFPNATLSLTNTKVIGVGDFATDTLLQAQTASVTIDLGSLFGDEFSISKVSLDKASIYAKMLADGRANWDIVKTDSTATAETPETEDSPFNLNLNKASLNACNIVYEDLAGDMKAVLLNLNGNLSGDMRASETTLRIDMGIEELSFYMGKIPALHKVKAEAKGKLQANLDAMKFTFVESNVKLNELQAAIDGTFGLVGDDGMDFDLKLVAPDTEFKHILSMVPAMYTDDFKNLKTAGTASIDASVKGLMEGEIYPAFAVNIKIADAMFQYPSLPKSVDNINVDMAINHKEQGNLSGLIIDVSKFRFTLGGNPFSGAVNVVNPMGDANVKAHLNGTLDLSMIKDVYPLDKTELNGKIIADLDVATRLSAIDKGDYENVSAKGHLTVQGMNYKADDMPEVLVKTAALEFTPRYVNLTSLDVNIGKNDISATGRLENFIAYALKNETLSGSLNLKSNYLNANDFISSETSGVDAEAETTTEDIIIPKNINFALNADLKQIVYGTINITNMAGAMTVKDGILTLNNVGANALGGTAKISGTYNTANPQKPHVNFALNLSHVSFAETFKQVESIQKFAPIFDKLIGNYSMNFNFDTSLGNTLMQTLASLTGGGAIQTSDVKVENVEALTQLGSKLNTGELKSFGVKNLNLPFKIEAGRINTNPFDINLGKGGVMKLEGSTGLDQSINYKGSIKLGESLSNKYVKAIPLTIGGTFTSPTVSVDMKAMANDLIGDLAGQLLGGKDKSEGGETGSAIGEKIEETSAKVAAERTKRAEQVRNEAKKNAEKLVSAAQEQSDNLVAKAGDNKLAKLGAQTAGNKIVDVAKKEGNKLIEKADELAKKIEGGEE